MYSFVFFSELTIRQRATAIFLSKLSYLICSETTKFLSQSVVKYFKMKKYFVVGSARRLVSAKRLIRNFENVKKNSLSIALKVTFANS